MSTQVNALMHTDLELPGQVSRYQGKVRDVYRLQGDTLVMVASDRISAFDVVLPEGIPHKGQVLNQIANHFLDLTADIVPNWKTACPDPQVTVGLACEPYRIEMVIRGYLTGHAWRVYKAGGRMLCGVSLPEGLSEHDRLPSPIITPATKAEEGHDEDISKEDIIAQEIVPEAEYLQLEEYTRALFQRGTEYAAQQGLILVDTKYEFGKREGQIYLIDEIHTPDSSRYFYSEGYEARQAAGEEQRQLSKEFVRQWLISEGFQGLDGQRIPDMDMERVTSISERYIELFEQITGQTFVPADLSEIQSRVMHNVTSYLAERS